MTETKIGDWNAVKTLKEHGGITDGTNVSEVTTFFAYTEDALL